MVRVNPYPHLVWDNFIDEEKLQSVKQEVPKEDSDFWTWK